MNQTKRGTVATQQVIREVLADGPATAAGVAYSTHGLTVGQVRRELAVLCELGVVGCVTGVDPAEWRLL